MSEALGGLRDVSAAETVDSDRLIVAATLTLRSCQDTRLCLKIR